MEDGQVQQPMTLRTPGMPEPKALTALPAYCAALETSFREATASCDRRIHSLQVTDQHIELHMAGPTLEPDVLPALSHLVQQAGAVAPQVIFNLWDAATTGVWPPPPPFTTADYRRYGQRAVAYDGVRSLMYAPTTGQLFAYDREVHRGYFWTEDSSRLSIYEQAAPIQTLFHWAMAAMGWQVVHAAAVGNESGGVLLIGSTGAGKSTTALSCLAQDGLHLLSDDKCLVRLEPEPQASALFSSAKIKGDMLERLPHFRPLLAGWDDHYKANKGLIFLHPTYADHMVTTFPVKALLLPQVGPQERAAVYPAGAGEVFRQLGPSTVIWLPGAEADNYRFTAEMTRRLPCYRIELATDPQVNVEAIRQLLNELQ